jgi:PAS domain S-box-containing protein
MHEGERYALLLGVDITDHKLAEMALRSSEERYRVLFNSGNDAVFVHAPFNSGLPGKFVEVNDIACRRLGYSRLELLQMSPADIDAPETKAELPGHLARFEARGNAVWEGLHVAKNGRKMPVEIYAHQFELDGQPMVLSEVRDLTERKQAEMALRESEAKFRAIFNNSAWATAIIEPDSTISMVNDAYCKASGFARHEVVGKSWQQTVMPEDLERLLDYNRRRLINPKDAPECYEFRYYHKNGEVRHSEIAVALIQDSAQIIASLVDITQRRQAEETLRESEKKFSKMFHSSPLPMALSTIREGRYLDANHEFLKLLQRSREEVVGQTSLELNVWHDSKQRAAILANLKGEGTVRNVELQIRRGSGQIRDIIWSAEVLEIGGEKCWLGSLLDITERKRADELLRQERQLYMDLVNTQPAGIYRIRVFPKDQHRRDAWTNSEHAPYCMELASDRFCEILGVQRAVFTTNPGIVIDLVHPEDKAKFARENEEANISQMPFRWEGRLVIGGKTTWVHIESLPRPAANGDVIWTGILYDITEQKQAEDRMRLQSTALTAAANAIIITDRKGKIEWVNPAFSLLTGYGPAEVIGHNPRLLKSGQHPPEFYTRMWDTITAGNVWHGEIVNQHKDGRIIIEDTTITPVRDANGEIAHFVGIKQDITNRKQTDRLLSFIAQEGWNSPQADYFIRLVEYVGRTLAVDYVFIGLLRDDNTVQTRGHYAKGKILPDFEYSIQGAPCANVIGKALCHYSDGLQATFPADSLLVEMGAQSYLGIPLNDSAGQPLGLIAVLDSKPMPDAQLATALLQIAAVRVAGEVERLAKVDELRWKTALMEAQMEAAPDGILMIDNQGKRILQNQRINDLLKIPRHISEDEDGRRQLAFVASRAKDPGKMKDKVAYLYTHAEEISRDELEFVDGTIVDRYSSPVRDKAGNSCGRIWTFRDVTQARQLEAQLRQSQKMEAIGQLAGGVAHDFNNILSALLMQTDLIEMIDHLPEEAREGLKQLREDANRAAGLTRQLLLFGRRQVMQSRVLDLNDIINNLIKMLQRIIGEDVQLELDLHAVPLMTRADAGMVEQVLMNLAVNARDAMPEGGRLRIETTEHTVTESLADLCLDAVPGRYVCFSVSDTGGGIPQEILPRIFEPFFTTKEAGKGTGLGLATVFGIIKQHRGWIKVDNQPGHGATFRIFLPASSRTETSADQTEDKPSPRGGSETILLVEDELRVRKSVGTILQRRGYKVLAAANAVEALDLWQAHSHEVALLLTDLVMPGGMNGHELARQLESAASNLKVVYMSGYSAEIAGKDLELRSGETFVQKPFLTNHLLEAIRRSLDG